MSLLIIGVILLIIGFGAFPFIERFWKAGFFGTPTPKGWRGVLSGIATILFMLMILTRSILKISMIWLLIGVGGSLVAYSITTQLGLPPLITFASVAIIILATAEEHLRAIKTRLGSRLYTFLPTIIPGCIRYLRGIRETTQTAITFSWRDYTRGPVTEVQWLPAEKQNESETLASAITSHIVLWQPTLPERPFSTRRAIFTVPGLANGKATDLAISPDAQYIASSDINGHVDFYQRNWPEKATSAQLLKQKIININTEEAEVYYQSKASYWPNDSVNAVSWAPTLPYRVAFGSNDHTVKIWYIGDTLYEETREAIPRPLHYPITRQYMALIYRGHRHAITDIAWSPDGQFIASTSKDATAHVWSAQTGETVCIYRMRSRIINALAWSPDSSHIATTSEDGQVNVWNAQTGEKMIAYVGHKGAVLAVAWSPDGTRLATAGEDKIVRVWDVWSAKLQATYWKHRKKVLSVAWSSDNQRIASGGEDGTIHVWQIKG